MVNAHDLFREGLVWSKHGVGLCILIQHLSISPVVLNLKTDVVVATAFTHENIVVVRKNVGLVTFDLFVLDEGHFFITYLFRGPLVMGMLCILVDEGVQSLWNDGALNEQIHI